MANLIIKDGPNRVRCCLKEYGLKQSPMQWNSKLDLSLKKHEFEQTQNYPCVYISKSNLTYIIFPAIFVEDGLFSSIDSLLLNSNK